MRRGTAHLDLGDDGRLIARFGIFTLETALANVERYTLTGPYHWWRAIGPRGSGADHGFTFGTSTHGGVCLRFREWVPARYVRGGRMEALTVTVDDVDRLARALDGAGVPGDDLRTRR